VPSHNLRDFVRIRIIAADSPIGYVIDSAGNEQTDGPPGAAWKSPSCFHSSAMPAFKIHSGSPPACTTPPRIITIRTGRHFRISHGSGNSFPARSMPEPRRRYLWIARSGRRSYSTKPRTRTGATISRRVTGCSSAAVSPLTASREARPSRSKKSRTARCGPSRSIRRHPNLRK
jgi:hypothetical protein